ncbi:MAG: lipid-binding SYLF domain-containing protein [Candidatus Eisenbacteria bacterium]|uniref:Lipid-binding SYLF domain-containing protein n=1 Tax=Eiseniibacteriota bacterium TaxID=2212470 RepID=A0A538UB62_UNCEI|nr:MAG: lipid-binding SYLF domain-containing protein [Candidatus Eisenbacteria bacterium]
MTKLGGIMVAAVGACLALPALADKNVDDLNQKLVDAKAVYGELLATPDHAVPEALLKECSCIAVIPHAVKGALGYGARFGSGVMSCRTASGWSPPTFIKLTGGSVGLQFGAEASDLVLFFTNDRGARSLLTGSKVTLGGKASVAAGPFGRSGEASTDLKLNAEIYSYAKSKGLFAGLSFEGARLAADNEANRTFYGSGVTVKQLLFDATVTNVPASADDFRRTLP